MKKIISNTISIPINRLFFEMDEQLFWSEVIHNPTEVYENLQLVLTANPNTSFKAYEGVCTYILRNLNQENGFDTYEIVQYSRKLEELISQGCPFYKTNNFVDSILRYSDDKARALFITEFEEKVNVFYKIYSTNPFTETDLSCFGGICPIGVLFEKIAYDDHPVEKFEGKTNRTFAEIFADHDRNHFDFIIYNLKNIHNPRQLNLNADLIESFQHYRILKTRIRYQSESITKKLSELILFEIGHETNDDISVLLPQSIEQLHTNEKLKNNFLDKLFYKICAFHFSERYDELKTIGRETLKLKLKHALKTIIDDAINVNIIKLSNIK